MTEINHALTGALIGLTVDQPLAAVPLAFASHFVLDALPQWGPSYDDDAKRIASKQFSWLLIAEAGLCVLLVIILAIRRPHNWLLAAICAFVATLPDAFWFKRFWVLKKTGKYMPNRNWFWRFHGFIQWFAKPIGGLVEAAWFILALLILAPLV